MCVLEKSSGAEFQARNSSAMLTPINYLKWWISRFRGACRTNAVSEAELFVLLATFRLLYVTESSVLGAVRDLHVFRHFIIITVIIIIIIIIIIMIIVVFTIIVNITFIIIGLLGFLIKNSFLFLQGKLKVYVCFHQFLHVS